MAPVSKHCELQGPKHCPAWLGLEVSVSAVRALALPTALARVPSEQLAQKQLLQRTTHVQRRGHRHVVRDAGLLSGDTCRHALGSTPGHICCNKAVVGFWGRLSLLSWEELGFLQTPLIQLQTGKSRPMYSRAVISVPKTLFNMTWERDAWLRTDISLSPSAGWERRLSGNREICKSDLLCPQHQPPLDTGRIHGVVTTSRAARNCPRHCAGPRRGSLPTFLSQAALG